MTFLKTPDNHYWEVDYQSMRLYNYHNGWHDINENGDEWLNGEIIQDCADWHELFLKYHYSPLEGSYCSRTAWISPCGIFIEARSHECTAQEICDIWYGRNERLYAAGDYLEDLGWLKVSDSLMCDLYFDEYHRLTMAQYDAVRAWCEYHNLDYPERWEVRV